MKINSEKIELLDFFTDNASGIFSVPYYQRNYSWNEKQINALLEDIFYFKKNYKNKKNHFFGVIVSKEYHEEESLHYELIDGQQRLATLSIFVKALLKFIDEEKIITDKKIKEKLISFLWKNDDKDIKIRLQLDNEESDSTTYNQIIKSEPVSNSKNLLFKNYNKIQEYLKNNINLSNNMETNNLINIFFKMQIVHIILEKKEDNPQNVFESLNSKGMELSVVDLIKNYLFMNINQSQQKILYKDYWKPIEENIKPATDIEKFFRDLVTLKNKKSYEKLKTIYFDFKNTYKEINDNNIESYLKEIKYWLKIYISVTKHFNKSKLKETDENSKVFEKINKIVSITYSYKSSIDVTPMIYMYFVDKFIFKKDKKDYITFEKITSLLNKYIIRWTLQSNGHLHGPFVKIIKDLEEKENIYVEKNNNLINFPYHKIIKEIILNSLGGQFVYFNDEDTQNAFRSCTSEKLNKYILEQIEKNKNEKFNKTYTLEHIRPKDKNINNSKDWEFLESHGKIVNLIGNLAFIEKELNGQCSNKSFLEKKEIYKESKSYTISNVIRPELNSWQITDIRSRTNILFKNFLELFTIQ